MKTRAPLVALASVLAAAIIPACGSSDKPSTPAQAGSGGDASVGGSAGQAGQGGGTGGSAKQQGTEGGPCYPNSTCNASLTCLSNLCVNAGAGGSGGTAGSAGSGGGAGSSGSAGVGGTAGDGGAAGTSGTAGSGGSAGDASVEPDAADSGGSAGTDASVDSNGDAGSIADAAEGGDAGTDPILYGPCSTLGALNCNGHAQKVQLLCDGTKWVATGACSGQQLCDTSPGPNQGLCSDPVLVCLGHQPNEPICDDTKLVNCGPDLVTATSMDCPYACVSGICTGVCAPGTKQCGGLTPQSCNGSGQWVSGVVCTSLCYQGTCNSHQHTIVVDGINDFDSATERFNTSSGAPSAVYGYVTWDADFLFLGMEGAVIGLHSSGDWVLGYIGGTPGSKTGIGYGTQSAPELPTDFKYHVRWRADGSYVNAQKWNGGAWVDASWAIQQKSLGTYMEMAISRLDLESPTKVQIVISLLRETAGSEWTWASVPSTSIQDGKNVSYAKYLDFDLLSATSPNAYSPLP